MPKTKATAEKTKRFYIYLPESIYAQLLAEKNKLDPYRVLNLGISPLAAELIAETLRERQARDKVSSPPVKSDQEVATMLYDWYCDSCEEGERECSTCSIFKVIKILQPDNPFVKSILARNETAPT